MANNRSYIQRTLQLEKAFIPKLISIIKAYRNGFISDLKSHGRSTALSNLQQTPTPESLTRAINAVYRRAGLFGALFLWNEQGRYLAEARRREQKAGFGRNEQWIADVLNYLKFHMLRFVQDITETMRADIIRILDKGVAEGLSIDQIVRQLSDEGLIRSRARVIARTEINRASNVGHSVAAQTLPYEVDKKWSAASDQRTRHSHRLINDHQVDENDFFKVPIYKGDKPTGGYDEMLYPGDATASAANTVNCRCRVVYIPKRDANGRLVMRSPNRARIIPMRQVPRYDPAQIAAILKANIHIGVEK